MKDYGVDVRVVRVFHQAGTTYDVRDRLRNQIIDAVYIYDGVNEFKSHRLATTYHVPRLLRNDAPV